MKQLYLFIISLLICLVSARAQSVIHIQNGANIVVQPQTLLSLDGLQITPTSNLVITNMSLERKTTIQIPSGTNHIQRVYRFSTPLPAFSGIIRFQYHDDELNNIAETALVLNIYNGSQWKDFRTNITRDASNNFVETSITDAINIQEITLMSIAGALPLKWGEVKAACNNNIISVQWETVQEINTKHFIVERSADGLSWQTVQTKAASNESGVSVSYSVSDNYSGADPILYYRIKSVDQDGSFSYSKTITIKPCSFISNSLKLFPNPATTSVQLSFIAASPQKASVRIFNSNGQLVNAQDVSLVTGSNLFTVDLRALPAGTYRAQLSPSNQPALTTTFIKL